MSSGVCCVVSVCVVLCCLRVPYVQARAQIIEKAAKVPASPCPLMMGVV